VNHRGGTITTMEQAKGVDFSTSIYKSFLLSLGELLKCVCCPFVCLGCGPFTTVRQGAVGVLTEFGVFKQVLQPGLYSYNAAAQAITLVNMRTQAIDIPPQRAMTRDNLSVKIDAVTFATVVDPKRALFEVENYQAAVRILAGSTLLRIIAEHDLQQIFTNRATINVRLTEAMHEKGVGWGLKVHSVELRDITIPDAMQRAMAQIAEANREADAKVIVARGQQKASSIFADAAATMKKNPMSLQLQWFETLRQISNENNSTIIVPDSLLALLPNLKSNPGA